METNYTDIVSDGGKRSLVFAVNRLDCPDVTERDREPYLTKRSDKALPFTDENDAILIVEKTDPAYVDWLRSVGLCKGKILEFDAPEATPMSQLMIERAAEVRDFVDQLDNPIILPHISGPEINEAAEAIGVELFGCSGEITHRFYDKWLFKQFADEIGIPVVPGTRVNGTTRPEIERIIGEHMQMTGETIVKSTTAAGGDQQFIANRHSLDEAVEFAHSQPGYFVIESRIPVAAETTNKWIIDKEGGIYRAGASVQIINGTSHIGNDFPIVGLPIDAVHEDSRRLMEAKRDAGYVGICSLDILYQSNGQYFFCEDNARVGGSLYADEIMHRLESSSDHWRTRKVTTRSPMSFNQLLKATEDLTYRGEAAPHTFFPYDISLLETQGRFIGLFTGETQEGMEQVYKEVTDRLC